MIDRTPTDTTALIPDFTPVPRKCARYDGWTPERQTAFIEALAQTGSVKAAAKAVNMAFEGAYMLRRAEGAEGFRAAWIAALDHGVTRLEDVAMERAIHGVEVPVYSYGKLIGTRIVYNDRLLMFILRNRASERFVGGRAGAMSALDKETLARLKKEWRAAWKREYALEAAAQENAGVESLIAQVQRMHRNWYCALSPAARAAYRAFRSCEDNDRTGHWRAQPGAEPLTVAEAEYEAHFGEGRDDRAQIAKLADMRLWEGEDAGGIAP